ncbi:MAG TPA: 2Fe-2S iron-sulfur cluster-binding protein [Rhizobiaceae bacterium]|nr:2Fe-2S iron-sulfur cluster-binding protein [Rhizobiaceae bacterium]
MHITLIDRDGRRHRLEAVEGFRVMEIIRDWGFDIRAECGGACACATCHVYVGEDWVDRLAPPRDDEEDMLDSAFSVETNSRLSCQLLMTPELDGLEVKLAPGTERERKAA